MRRGIIVVAIAGSIGACSLFTDLGGLSGGAYPAEGGPDALADVIVGDGGSDGASTTDAAFTCPPDAIACEDFEGAQPTWDKADEERGATCNVNSDKAHRGTRSLHASAPFDATGFANGENQNQCYFEHALPMPALTSGKLAIRAYLYLVGAGQTGNFDISWLREAQGVGACHDGNLFSGPHDGTWKTTAHNEAGYVDIASIAAPIYDRWICVEWVLDLAAHGHMTMSVESEVVIDKSIDYATADPLCGFRALDIGIVGHQSSGPVEAYWDDIVIATHPIGCN